jgi:hypothetical protein
LVRVFWARVRFAGAGELAVAALISIAAAVLMEKLGNVGGEIFFGVLLGLGCGLGTMALLVWQRGRLSG